MGTEADWPERGAPESNRRDEQFRLMFFEGLIAALDRRDEVSAVMSQAQDADAARGAVAQLLGISDVAATAVMDMQWRRFTVQERQRLVDQRDALARRARP